MRLPASLSPHDELHGLTQAARQLGLAYATVKTRCLAGQLPAISIDGHLFVRQHDLDDYQRRAS